MSVLRAFVSRVRSLIGQAPFFNEETRVARYIVLAESAGGFSVPGPSGISDRHFLDVTAPGVVPQVLPVLFFRTTHSGTPTMSLRLNSANLTRHTFTDANPRSWHELIPSGALQAEGNELTFAVNGDGSVQFTDVVILYTSNQLTIKTPPVLSPD